MANTGAAGGPATLEGWIDAGDSLHSTTLALLSSGGPGEAFFSRLAELDQRFGAYGYDWLTKAYGDGATAFIATWQSYGAPLSSYMNEWPNRRAQVVNRPAADPLAYQTAMEFCTGYGKALTLFYNEGFYRALEGLNSILDRIYRAMEQAIDRQIALDFDQLHPTLSFVLEMVDKGTAIAGLAVGVAGLFTPIPMAGTLAAGLVVAAERLTTFAIRRIVISQDRKDPALRAKVLSELNLQKLPSGHRDRLAKSQAGLAIVCALAEGAVPGISAMFDAAKLAPDVAEKILMALEYSKEVGDKTYELIESGKDGYEVWETIKTQHPEVIDGSVATGIHADASPERRLKFAQPDDPDRGWARWGNGREDSGRQYYAGFLGNELVKQYLDGADRYSQPLSAVWVERFDSTGEAGWLYPDGSFRTETEEAQFVDGEGRSYTPLQPRPWDPDAPIKVALFDRPEIRGWFSIAGKTFTPEEGDIGWAKIWRTDAYRDKQNRTVTIIGPFEQDQGYWVARAKIEGSEEVGYFYRETGDYVTPAEYGNVTTVDPTATSPEDVVRQHSGYACQGQSGFAVYCEDCAPWPAGMVAFATEAGGLAYATAHTADTGHVRTTSEAWTGEQFQALAPGAEGAGVPAGPSE